MKIVIFTGSGHVGSKCYLLAERELLYLKEHYDIEDVHIFEVPKLKIHECLGCDYCLAHQNECIIHDEMDLIYKVITQADKLIFISPSYFSNIPAGLKKIIDRCQLFYNLKDKKNIKPKECLAVCTGGAPAYPNQFTAFKSTYKVLFPDIKAKLIDFIEIPNCDKTDFLNDQTTLDRVRSGIDRLMNGIQES